MPDDLYDIESFWEGLRPRRETEPDPEPQVQRPAQTLPEGQSSWEVTDMIGLTMSSVAGGVGDDSLMFTTTEGIRFELYHAQDCCENVRVEDIIGDLGDLVGYPLVESEELTSEPDPILDYEPESCTWTFYRFSTVRGTVTVRWFGESNGYYSESVEFRHLPNLTEVPSG
jgi:hypothetical protein